MGERRKRVGSSIAITVRRRAIAASQRSPVWICSTRLRRTSSNGNASRPGRGPAASNSRRRISN
jgi:hypothetical protein